MNTNSVLLAYATRFGSTQEVAESVAAALREAGLKVDLQLMSQVESLDPYEAEVLGAAIYNAKWHAEAHQFLARYQAALMQRLVAIFTLGPLSSSAAAMRNSRRQLDKELAKYRWLKPVAVEVFAGKYDPRSRGLGFFERRVPASDHRNWDAIRAWANTLPPQIRAVFNNAGLAKAYCQEADFSDAQFRGADLTATDLTSAQLGRADLRGANLTGAKINSATLVDANLEARISRMRNPGLPTSGAPTLPERTSITLRPLRPSSIFAGRST